MSPADILLAVNKVAEAGNRRVMLTERGTFFGYNNLVVDFRSIPLMKESGCPVVMDATHSVQRPSAAAGVSGGDPRFIPMMAAAGITAGANGVFLEVHPRPEKALSDGLNSLPLGELRPLLIRLQKLYNVALMGSIETGKKVLQTEANAILKALDRVDHRFETAVDILFHCRGQVVVTGMGKSGLIGRKIAATMTSTGSPAVFLHPAEAIHGDIGIIHPEDVVIALSTSGETGEVTRMLNYIKRLGIKLIALVGNPALDPGPAERRLHRLQRRKGSLPDRAGALGLLDPDPGRRRRPLHRPDGEARLQRGRFPLFPPGRRRSARSCSRSST